MRLRIVVGNMIGLGIAIFIAGCAPTHEVIVLEKVDDPIVENAEPATTPPPTSKTIVEKQIPAISSECKVVLQRFYDAGVVLKNVNVVIERGLSRTDFVGKTNNTAFQVLADARKLGCKYHSYYLQ